MGLQEKKVKTRSLTPRRWLINDKMLIIAASGCVWEGANSEIAASLKSPSRILVARGGGQEWSRGCERNLEQLSPIPRTQPDAPQPRPGVPQAVAASREGRGNNYPDPLGLPGYRKGLGTRSTLAGGVHASPCP